MKKIITILVAAFVITNAFAQAPSKMSYQAVVRGTGNVLVSLSPVSMRVSILQGSATGTPVYVENQTATTNENGLISIEIGNGTAVTGNFSAISWSNGPYFIKTETDPAGGTNYSISGTSELISVPYALYAETSGTPGPQGATGLPGGDSHRYFFQNNNVSTPSPEHISFDDNNAPIHSIYINKVNGDGIDISSWMNSLTASTNSKKGRIKIFQEDDASNFVILDVFNVTLSGNSYQLSTSYVTGNPLTYPNPHFTNSQRIILTFSAAGDKGDQGVSGPAGNNGLTTSVNNVQEVNGNITLSSSDLGLGNVDNTADADKPVSSATQTALDLKANMASPSFTGTPTAPTATAGTNDTQIATTEFVTNAVSTEVGNYLPLSGGSVTGTISGTSISLANNLDITGKSTIGTNVSESTPNLKLIGYASDSVNGGGGLEIGDGGAVHMRIYRTSSNYFNISTLGSLGERIGINADYDPQYTLDINGSLRAKGNTSIEGSMYATGDIGGDAAHFTGDMSVEGTSMIGTNQSQTIPSLKLIGYSSDGVDGGGGLELGDGGAVRMRIYRTSSNNFNISTVGSFYEYLGINANYDPAYTLDINGTLRAKGNTVLEGNLAITGTPTAPTATSGTNNTQLATTAFVNSAVTKGIALANIKTVVTNPFVTLDSTYSGKTIPTQWGAQPSFPNNLPDGFTCEIINYSNFTFTTNTLASPARFFTKTSGWNSGTGVATFSIPSGGTVRINVVTVNGQKGYFVTGDVN